MEIQMCNRHMVLSQRLQAILAQICCEALADIGTDHGYIPIAACERGLANRAIACDISRPSLQKAAENIRARGLESKIETRLGDGLERIAPGEVDAAVLSGMGGMLMIEILRRGGDVARGLKRLILQPQMDIPPLRRAVHAMGFRIADECMVYEDGKFYTVIHCQKGIDAAYNDEDYFFGKILLDRKDGILKQYLRQTMSRQEEILASIAGSSADVKPEARRRLSETEAWINMAKEVLACL